MKNIDVKNYLPHLLIAFGFWIVSAVYFLPIFQGKAIPQSDIQSWEGMAKEALDYNKTHDDPALWSNSMFGGMPLYQTAMTPKGNLLRYIQNLPHAFGKSPINIFFTMMLFSYLGLMLLGVNRYLAALGAILLSFSSGNILLLEAGHMTKLMVISYAAISLAGVWISYKGNMWLGVLLFAFGFGMQIMNNHVQMSYYIMLSIVPIFIYFLMDTFKTSNWKSFLMSNLLLGLAALLGLTASSTMLLTTQEYVKQTMRGGSVLSVSNTGNESNKSGLEWDYATAWSNGWLDLSASIIPGVAGGSSGEKVKSNSALKDELKKARIPIQNNMRVPTYWGALPFTGGPFYFGIVVVFFFILGLWCVHDPIKWWLGMSTLILCLLSLGKHFEILNKFLFDFLPYYNKFRAPSSILTVAAIPCTIFSVYTLSQLYLKKIDIRSILKPLIYTSGILSGICLFFWIMGPGFFDMTGGKDTQDTAILVGLRKAMMSSDSMRGLVIILISAGITYFFIKDKLKSNYYVAAIAILAIIDIFTINQRYLSHSDFIKKSSLANAHTPRQVDQQILDDKSLGYRVMDLTIDAYNSAMPSYFHRMVGGYHPAKLRRFQDLIDHCLDLEKNKLQSVLQQFNGNPADSNFIAGMNQLFVYNMLNTKYLILGEPGKELALLNPAANGTAWFVNNIQWVQSADEEINALKTTNLKSTAVIHEEWKSQAGNAGDANGKIEMSAYEPNMVQYSSESNADQLAVFSEIWYGPDLGWKAFIDGKEVELFRVNYALRGLKIPAGKHDIKMEFKPKSFVLGEQISYFGSGLLILLLGLVAYRQMKRE